MDVIQPLLNLKPPLLNATGLLLGEASGPLLYTDELLLDMTRSSLVLAMPLLDATGLLLDLSRRLWGSACSLTFVEAGLLLELSKSL